MENSTIQPQFSDAVPSQRTTPLNHLEHPVPARAQPSNSSRHSHSSSRVLAETHSTSGTTTQNRESKSSSKFAQWKTKWISDWWGAEIACWIIAALSVVGIVIALECLKNKPVPKWSFGITLNSLVSILATAAQMAMMKPIVECISQLKWLWFVRKQKISGFQAFDDASRGPTGSLVLLGQLGGLHLISLGAVITIVAVAFGPFAQQIVTYPLVMRPDGIATVQQVFNFTGDFSTGLGLGVAMSPVMTAAVFQGMARGSLNLSSLTPSSCRTGNCTWPPYPSLGICPSVKDISSTIRNNSCNNTAFEEIFEIFGITNPGYKCFNFTLPEVVILPTYNGGLQPIGNATLTNDLVGPSLEFNTSYAEVLTLGSTVNSSPSLSTSYLLYQPDFLNSTLPSPIAYRLDLDLCIQTYNTTVSNGVVNTTLLSSQLLRIDDDETYYPSDYSVSFAGGGNDTYVTVENKTFGISASGANSLLSNFQSFLSGLCYGLIPSAGDGQVIETQPFTCSLNSGDAFLDALANSTDPLLGVTELIENIATSITNAMRIGAGGDTQIGNFEGTAFTPVVFVETNYLWLILPIGLVCLTLVFLLATILKSQRLGSRVWKSSNLATLQGLHIDLHTKLGALSSVSAMEEKVKDLRVRFDMGSDGAEQGVEYRLVESKQEAYWKG